MNAPLLISVGVTLTTALAATLWAVLVATGMTPDAEHRGRRDGRPR